MTTKGIDADGRVVSAVSDPPPDDDDDDEVDDDEDDEENSPMIELSPSSSDTKNNRRPPPMSMPSGLLVDASSYGVATSTISICIAISSLVLLLFGGVLHLGRSNAVRGHGEGGTSTSTSTSPKFTRRHLEETRRAADGVLTTLDEYWYGRETARNMLMKSWLDPWEFDDVSWPEKAGRNAKLVDTLLRALISDDQDSFVIGAIGSSVMAGHDNCHYDGYQSQMERTWGPVWKAAGMDFVIQNAGEGGGCGDSFQNQGMCITQNISPNVDLVHWSWTYFGEPSSEIESLVRWTQLLPKQPPLHQLNLGTTSGTGSQLATHYAKYGHNCLYMRTAFDNGGHDYVSEQNRPVDPFDRFGWGYVGDGYHNTTRYGELETDDVRKNSLGVVMRNWHPGPMGFQIISDAFTYVYTQALLYALDLIEAEMNDGKDPRDTWSSSKRVPITKNDLPAPILCDPEYCTVNEPPKCLNFELPTFGVSGARIEDANDESNPYGGINQNWTVWHAPNDLWYMVDQDDVAFFQNREEKDVCRHLDACGGVSAQGVDDGTVVFRLPTMSVGLVIICAMSEGTSGVDLFINNTNIEIGYNTVPVDRAEMDLYPWDGKCTRVMKRFPTSGRISESPTGHVYLDVKVLKDMDRPFRITQVITL